jgi:TetR/AcrR family transcriptional regulator
MCRNLIIRPIAESEPEMSKRPNARLLQGQQTRAVILEAALTLFAERGYEGTSIDQIASRSATSRGLIIHHFQNKQELWSAVERHVSKVFETSYASRFLFEEMSPAALRAYVAAYHDFFVDNPQFQNLGLWKLARGERTPWPGEEDIVRAIHGFTTEGQNAGLIRKDVPALQLMMIMTGAVYFWLLNKDRFGGVLTPAGGVPASDAELIDSVVRLVLTPPAADMSA